MELLTLPVINEGIMSKLIPKIPDEDEEREFIFDFSIKRPSPDSLLKGQAWWKQIVIKFRTYFDAQAQVEANLAGRIHELHTNTLQALQELETIKAELSKKINPDLYAYVEAVMDPMLNDLKRIHDSVNNDNHQTAPYNIVQKYTQWIDRARLWVQLYAKAKDSQDIAKAVVKYAINQIISLIERDIKVINEYEEQRLSNLKIVPEGKLVLKQSIENALENTLASLQSLKKAPESLIIEKVDIWKKECDAKRMHYFNEALHAIDQIVDEFVPLASPETHYDEHGILEVANQIINLEEELLAIQQQLENANTGSIKQKTALQLRLSALKDRLDSLESDMHISPELNRRLEVAAQSLFSIMQSLDQLDLGSQ